MSRIARLLGALFVFLLWVSLSKAESIRESNYLHADPDLAIWLNKWFDPSKPIKRVPKGDGIEVFGVSRVRFNDGGLLVRPNREDAASLVLTFDREMCAIGAQVKIASRKERNRVEVRFAFFDEAGVSLDVQTRWPANGTTKQSFSSVDPLQGFSAMQISSPSERLNAIGNLWFLPCASPLS